jgi:TRAP-type C4-dicarboxylate transport system permease small subunit
MELRRVLAQLAKINEYACESARKFAGLLLIAMLVVVILQIVFRYVLNDSLIWTEELAKTMMVWTALLVAPWAYRAGANIRIELFVNEMPRTFRKSLELLLNLLVLWIVIVFLHESLGFWQRGLTVRADSLPIQVAWFYTVIPLALSLLLLVGAEQVLRNVLALKYPDEDFELSNLDDVYEFE